MAFNFSFNTNPPSTPDRNHKASKGFDFGALDPSTTPAGPPPPSSAGSFTPAGNPSPSYLKSSIFGGSSPIKQATLPKQRLFGDQDSTISARSGLRKEFQSSPPATRSYGFAVDDYETDEEGDDHGDEDVQDKDLEDDSMVATTEDNDDGNSGEETYSEIDGSPGQSQNNSVRNGVSHIGARDNRSYQRHMTNDQSYGSRDNLSLFESHGQGDLRASFVQDVARKAPELQYTGAAKDIYHHMGAAEIFETDDLILETENIMDRLYTQGIGAAETETELTDTLQLASSMLLRLWAEYDEKYKTPPTDEYITSIGPGATASPFAKANFIAQLLVRIQHCSSTPSQNTSLNKLAKPLPHLLIEWLGTYHVIYASQLQDLYSYPPSSTAHRLFWNIALNGLLRGEVKAVVNLLHDTDWRHAWRAPGDISSKQGSQGYTGDALANVQKVVKAAANTLSTCPAFSGDWNSRSSDWTLFRRRVVKSVEALKELADGRHGNSSEHRDSMAFSRSSFGGGMYSRTANMAESRVPWHIYQSLMTLYNIVLGEATAIIGCSQDWLEATIGLFIWYDEGVDTDSLSMSRRRSILGSPSVQKDTQKLHECFLKATSDTTDFKVDTLSHMEVSLACLLEEDYESTFGFLRAWSGPISSAVAELGSYGGWLPPNDPENLLGMDELDEDDMLLLGHGAVADKHDSIKDQTLISYARSLSQHKSSRNLKSELDESGKDAWEITIALLGRLDSDERTNEMVEQFSKNFPLTSSTEVDKLWAILNRLNMQSHAERIAMVNLGPVFSSSPLLTPRRPMQARLQKRRTNMARQSGITH